MQDLRERGRTIPPAQSSKLNIFGAPLFVLSDGSAIPMVIGEQIVPPGHAIPNHVHADDDELFYVIEGELTISEPQGDRHSSGFDSFAQVKRGFLDGSCSLTFALKGRSFAESHSSAGGGPAPAQLRACRSIVRSSGAGRVREVPRCTCRRLRRHCASSSA
jgi:hypothetical protein